jgi:DNA-binding Lrp family transcriptional regulator
MTGVDDLDRKILSELGVDGRRPVVWLARKLRVPRATVQERLRRLFDSGVLRRVVAVPDHAQLGLGVTAYILAAFGPSEARTQREVAEEIARLPGVFEVSLISGEWDILLKVRASSVEAVGELVVDRLRLIRGIERTQTCLSFSSVKESP